MKFISQQQAGSVLCIMPNGDCLEITMLETEGEECVFKPDVQAAACLIAKHKCLTHLWIKSNEPNL